MLLGNLITVLYYQIRRGYREENNVVSSEVHNERMGSNMYRTLHKSFWLNNGKFFFCSEIG